jgi:hypothetical protein
MLLSVAGVIGVSGRRCGVGVRSRLAFVTLTSSSSPY